MGEEVLVLGNGAREHSLAWKLAQSPYVSEVFCAPGNGGTAAFATNLPELGTVKTLPQTIEFAKKERIGLTVVGPEALLFAGAVDAFTESNLPCFGPYKSAAFLEEQKADAKILMEMANVSTAKFRIFSQYDEARKYLEQQYRPLVIKASGPALGKGAYVCQTREEQFSALKAIMVDRVHGEAGDRVVIEELLHGQEVSIHALCSGEDCLLFQPSQDHKPAYDKDKGPNTGGMGAFAPVPWVGAELLRSVKDDIIGRTLRCLKSQCSTNFNGLLYPGLMIDDGAAVLEFNIRFGDPETSPLMMLLDCDLYELLKACIYGRLNEVKIKTKPGFAVTVVMASKGYPGDYEKGIPIEGIEDAEKIPGVTVFHAGTALIDGVLRTAGGRVLDVTGYADTLPMAINIAYQAVSKINPNGLFYRTDIGAKAL